MSFDFSLLLIPGAFILGGILLGLLSSVILNRYGRAISNRTATKLDNMLIEVFVFPVRATLFVLGFQLAARQFVIPLGWWNVLSPLFFLTYWIIGSILVYRLVDQVFHWYEDEIVHKTETDLDDKFLNLFRRLALLVLVVVLAITLLGRFDIELGALITSLGVGSLAVALAAQDTLGNLFAGLTIMIDRPFKVGDRVELLDIDTWGDVVEIGLRSTRIRTKDNRMVTVPNSVIGNGLIVNLSDPDTRLRIQTTVGVAYGTDIEIARTIIVDAIKKEPWVMLNQPIEALFLEFGDSSLNFNVWCWIEDYTERKRIIDRMNTAIYQALNNANIEIPFPQRDLHIVSSKVKLGDGG